MISHADFARLVKSMEPLIAHSRPVPTYFDVLTAVAFKYFAEQKVDIAVIETGLYNLTNDEVPVLVHLGSDQVEKHLLVRLKKPDDAPEQK